MPQKGQDFVQQNEWLDGRGPVVHQKKAAAGGGVVFNHLATNCQQTRWRGKRHHPHRHTRTHTQIRSPCGILLCCGIHARASSCLRCEGVTCLKRTRRTFTWKRNKKSVIHRKNTPSYNTRAILQSKSQLNNTSKRFTHDVPSYKSTHTPRKN